MSEHSSVRDLERVQAEVRAAGLGWAVYTDYMPASVATDPADRSVGCVLIRVNAGRTERFASAADASAFVARAAEVARRNAARAEG